MARTHEWAWGSIGGRTVCGQTRCSGLAVVVDLGAVREAERCGNCERMRAAIGTSSRPPAAATSPERAELAELEWEVMAHATGWSSRWPLHRNEFCAHEGEPAWRVIQGLIDRGLMRRDDEPARMGGLYAFNVTALGIAALKRAGRRMARSEASETSEARK